MMRRVFNTNRLRSFAVSAMSASVIADGYCTRIVKSEEADSDDSASSRAVLLLSDVDDTLIGNASALKQFNKVWCRYCASKEGKGSLLVYNTARPLGPGSTGDGFIELVASKTMPVLRPDAIIVSEGTEIYWVNEDNALVPDEQWEKKMSSTFDKQAAANVLSKHDEKIWKPDKDFNSDDRFRFAITVSDENKARRVVAEARDALGSNYKVNVAQGWIEDMWIVTALPLHAGKDKAAAHVRDVAGFANSTRCMWAGDSDNDIPMLNLSGVLLGTVVGNAKSSTLRSRASSDSSVYQAEDAYAGGILEGLYHYGLIPPEQDNSA